MSRSSLARGFGRIPIPAASRRTHLRAAGALWSAVGLGLLVAGSHWVFAAHSRYAPAVLALALILGWMKARFVLARPALRAIRRIEERGDGRCIGGFLSWKSWLLALGMAVLGRALRASPLPLLWRGLIYAAIGSALLFASFAFWSHLSRRGL